MAARPLPPCDGAQRAADAASYLASLSVTAEDLVAAITGAPHGVPQATLDRLARDFADMAAGLAAAAAPPSSQRDAA